MDARSRRDNFAFVDTPVFRSADDVSVKHIFGQSEAAWQRVAFGVIELDEDDVVRTYNSAESSLARRRPEATLGKNFFSEVAPCTDVAEFRGRVRSLVTDGDEVRFDYVFAFPWGERRVRVRAIRSGPSRWLFVTPLGER